MIQDPGSLANLRDLVPPAPVPFWPPAPGWFGVAAAGLVLVAWAVVWAAQRRRANAYRVAALAEIDALDRGGRLDLLPEVLRRTALAAFPRTQIAPRVGPDWLAFLDATGGAFRPADGELLLRIGYEPGGPETSPAARSALIGASRRWVREHRPASSRPEEAAC